ncbi:MAG: hypothetical protein DWQ36_05300 [Acidobacteria bacterium]|nr:MAG: hypothetical protein DWQ36_05300 [Acidobacteriota bacterium]
MPQSENDPLGNGATSFYVSIPKAETGADDHVTILRGATREDVLNAPCWTRVLTLSKDQWRRHFAQAKKRYHRCDDPNKTRREAWIYKMTAK